MSDLSSVSGTPSTDDAGWAGVAPTLRARRAIVAGRWYAAIARTGFSPRPAAEVREELGLLVDHAIAVLLAEPPAPARARGIGAALAALRFVHPDALSGTISVLGEELIASLTPEQTRTLHPRLAALLGAVAGGFYDQARAMILEEQDAVRRALFVTRQQAEAAEEARAAAEAAIRVRTDVLNATAHDLRSPITTIIGRSDLLGLRLEREPSPPPDWLRTQAAAIRAGAARIQVMLEELLDVARLQTGQTLELRVDRVDVGALARDVASRWDTGTPGTPPVRVDAPAGLIVDADRARLERVMENLLGNAVKYSPSAAPIDVEARPRAGAVVISLRDRGVGIPADELPQLFTPFFRASTARGLPGVGIGLSGAKAIVEQHGGHIAVESVAGRGTTVTIMFPAAGAAGLAD